MSFADEIEVDESHLVIDVKASVAVVQQVKSSVGSPQARWQVAR
jgi:hypothetical protein